MISITNKELEYIPVDPLSGRMPVFVCSHEMSRGTLRDFFLRNQNETTVINDSDDIQRNIKKAYRDLRYEVPLSKLRDSLAKIANPLKVSIGEFSLSISNAAANRKPSDNKTLNGSLVYIHEDNIQAERIVELTSLYDNLPAETRPLVFFEPRAEELGLVNKLSVLKCNIKVMPIGQAANWKKSWGNTTERNFIDDFLSHSYTACENSKDARISAHEMATIAPDEIIHRLATESLIIKSYDAMGNKFEALPVAYELLKKIDIAREYMRSDRQINYLLSLRAIVNLWISYIDESASYLVDNSMAIAEHLDNQHLKAHCQRLAHLVTGFGEVTGAMVLEAIKYFKTMEDHEAYVYSQTNLLLNELNTKKVDVARFTELSDFAISETPYLDRLATIVNNAGTALLVNGRNSDAIEMYKLASQYSGQDIHHIGLDVNLLTAKYMEGENLSEDEILRVHNKIARTNLPKQYDYHQSYIHWNLIKMAGANSDVSNEIFKYLEEKSFMDYGAVISGRETMVEYLAKNMISAKSRGRFGGVRGSFIHRTEIFPITHFQWM